MLEGDNTATVLQRLPNEINDTKSTIIKVIEKYKKGKQSFLNKIVITLVI
jgi:hypothetical protein